ncbi:FAD/NAD(P)-binding protein [Planctomycetaceae bacterium SH139]
MISNPWQPQTALLGRVTPETPGITTYELAIPGHSLTAFQPGQFNMLYLPGIGEAAISIAGLSRDGERLLHTVRAVGAVTQGLQRLSVGSTLGLRGPYGTAWPFRSIVAAEEPVDVIVVAGGIGLAPLKALLDNIASYRGCFQRVFLLLGARSPDDLIYQSSLDEWRAHEIDVQITVDCPSDDWRGHVGVVTLLLERLTLPRPHATHVMTCGPEVMMRYVAKTALEHRIPQENIWVTLERHMNCAIGFCGHCQLGPEFICKDGPVFRYDRVSKWLRTRDL